MGAWDRTKVSGTSDFHVGFGRVLILAFSSIGPGRWHFWDSCRESHTPLAAISPFRSVLWPMKRTHSGSFRRGTEKIAASNPQSLCAGKAYMLPRTRIPNPLYTSLLFHNPLCSKKSHTKTPFNVIFSWK